MVVTLFLGIVENIKKGTFSVSLRICKRKIRNMCINNTRQNVMSLIEISRGMEKCVCGGWVEKLSSV